MRLVASSADWVKGLNIQPAADKLSSMDRELTTDRSHARDSIIACHNSQGLPIRATLVRLTRHAAVFEVYNPFSILQYSEVLSDFKIYMGERLIYSGRAVVTSQVNTGLLQVCETSLEELAWLDVDLFSPVNQREKLQAEFREFLREWQKIRTISPDFKVTIADLQAFLVDLRRWLEQVELGIRSEPNRNVAEVEREVILELEAPMLPVVMAWFARFDEVAEQVDEGLRPIHRAYARRQLHPLLLCAPFVYRCFQKPLGYAGDYEMVNMILRDPFEGASLFAKIVNVCFLKNPPAEAHRNRIGLLSNSLRAEVQRVVGEGRRARVLNLGCGPAKEVQSFLAAGQLADEVDFTLLDFEDEALRHTGEKLAELKRRFDRATGIQMVKKSVHQILKEGLRIRDAGPAQGYDFIYCAGLFDYMSDRICKRLMNLFYDALAPGGLLLCTNVDAAKPFRHSLEYLLEWHLICRSQRQLKDLLPEMARAENFSITADPTGVNVFLEVRKPHA